MTLTSVARRWLIAIALGGVIAMSPLACNRPGAPPATKPGQQADAANLGFTLKDMNGRDVRLEDFKGKPILINFWSTTCEPCKAEVPDLVELYEKYKDRGFTVLGISIDDNAKDLQAFASKFKMSYPVLVGDGHDDLQDAYESYGIPTSWFIRKDGTIADKHIGIGTHEYFEQQIKAIL